MTAIEVSTDDLPRWDASGVHESLSARSFVDALERVGADVGRVVALFDERGVRAIEPRPVTADDGAAADEILGRLNATMDELAELRAFVHSFVSTDSFDDEAQAAASRIQVLDARLRPLHARLAEWVAALGPSALAGVSATSGR